MSISQKLMDPLPRKAISSVPKLANWAPFAFVVDSLLVRAADYAVGHRDRKHSMLLDKFHYLPRDTWVGSDVTTIIHFPVAQVFHLCILGGHDANSDLRRLVQVRTVKRNRGNWPTPQSLPSFLS